MRAINLPAFLGKASLILPFIVSITAVYLAQSDLLTTNPELSLFITIDLLLTAPILWLLLTRKRGFHFTTAIPFFIGGILAANYFLPLEQQFWLYWAERTLFPLVEISAFSYVFTQVRKTIKTLKEERRGDPDFFKAISVATDKIFGDTKIAKMMSFEVSVFYYGFLSLKKRATLDDSTFTYYRKNGILSVYIAFMLLVIAETAVTHILLMRWNVIIANIATLGSLYAVLQLWAHARAVMLRPIIVEHGSLKMKNGIAGDFEISLEKIDKVERSRRLPKNRDGVQQIGFLGSLETHNMILYLSEEIDIVGLYGSKKKGHTILFYVDEPDAFQKAITL